MKHFEIQFRLREQGHPEYSRLSFDHLTYGDPNNHEAVLTYARAIARAMRASDDIVDVSLRMETRQDHEVEF